MTWRQLSECYRDRLQLSLLSTCLPFSSELLPAKQPRIHLSMRSKSMREWCKSAIPWLLLLILFPVVLPFGTWLLWHNWGKEYLSNTWRAFCLKAREKTETFQWEMRLRLSHQRRHLLKHKLTRRLRKGKQAPSQSSPLLLLPAEIKAAIWRMVYEDTVIHMCWRPKGVGHFVCSQSPLQTSGLLEGPRYVECRCRGSSLHPGPINDKFIDVAHKKRAAAPAKSGFTCITGLHLVYREM